MPLRLTLAQALFECDRLAEILDLLAGDAPPAFAAEAAFHLGRAANHLGEFERAIPLLRTATHGGIARADGELARALARTGRLDEAVSAARTGLDRDPADIASLRTLGMILLQRGEARAAYDIARSLWDGGARTAQILWTWASAAGALGREAEFSDLMSREIWFAATKLGLDEAFNAAIGEEILASGGLAAANSYKPARGGVLRIDNFEEEEGPLAVALHGALRSEISRYLDRRAHRLDHPFIAGWPAALRLESWALAMDESGFEDWHIHASAWLGGVYYVRAPRRDGDAVAGRIGFGGLPAALQASGSRFPEWTVQPEPGLLILFPAYFPHRTWSTGLADERISIAFNAVPA
jgi:tetratricopeptide (TPR) repeat protein